jgi:hypothetical protein
VASFAHIELMELGSMDQEFDSLEVGSVHTGLMVLGSTDQGFDSILESNSQEADFAHIGLKELDFYLHHFSSLV